MHMSYFSVATLVILPQAHSCLLLYRTSKTVGCAVHSIVNVCNDFLRFVVIGNSLKNFSLGLQASAEEKEKMYISCSEFIQTIHLLVCFWV